MKKIKLRILKKSKRYPTVGAEFEVDIDSNGVILDRFLRRRLADSELEENPMLEVVKASKAKKVITEESNEKDHVDARSITD